MGMPATESMVPVVRALRMGRLHCHEAINGFQEHMLNYVVMVTASIY